MGWYANPAALGGILAGVLCYGAALVVFFAGPKRAADRFLAFVLWAEGTVLFFGNGLLYLTDDPATGYAIQVIGFYGGMGLIPAYLLFLGTLDSPLSRWLRAPIVRVVLLIGLAADVLAFHVMRPAYLSGMTSTPYARVEGVIGPAMEIHFLVFLAIFVFSLAVAVDTWRRAPQGSVLRQKAKAYAVAFGTRDVTYVALIVLDFTLWPEASALGFAWGAILFVPLLAYAALKVQLFDIDLRIKWTIRRGTVIAILAVAFVIVAETAQNWLSDSYGYLAGGLAAGALLLALRPLDRVGAKVADAAMPRVEETPTYVAYRKMEVYKAALEGASQDGEITPKEREMLRRLRESLQIADADASALEHDLHAVVA